MLQETVESTKTDYGNRWWPSVTYTVMKIISMTVQWMIKISQKSLRKQEDPM